MNTRLYLQTLGRFLDRGSDRKRLRQLSLAHCLAPHGDPSPRAARELRVLDYPIRDPR